MEPLSSRTVKDFEILLNKIEPEKPDSEIVEQAIAKLTKFRDDTLGQLNYKAFLSCNATITKLVEVRDAIRTGDTQKVLQSKIKSVKEQWEKTMQPSQGPSPKVKTEEEEKESGAKKPIFSLTKTLNTIDSCFDKIDSITINSDLNISSVEEAITALTELQSQETIKQPEAKASAEKTVRALNELMSVMKSNNSIAFDQKMDSAMVQWVNTFNLITKRTPRDEGEAKERILRPSKAQQAKPPVKIGASSEPTSTRKMFVPGPPITEVSPKEEGEEIDKALENEILSFLGKNASNVGKIQSATAQEAQQILIKEEPGTCLIRWDTEHEQCVISGIVKGEKPTDELQWIHDPIIRMDENRRMIIQGEFREEVPFSSWKSYIKLIGFENIVNEKAITMKLKKIRNKKSLSNGFRNF